MVKLLLLVVSPWLLFRAYRFIGDCIAMDRWRHEVYNRQPGWGR